MRRKARKIGRKEKIKCEVSSGNIFADVGYENLREAKLKWELAYLVRKRRGAMGPRSAQAVQTGYSSRLSLKHQLTVPKEIREHLRLQKGDRIVFELLSDDTVALRRNLPADKVSSL